MGSRDEKRFHLPGFEGGFLSDLEVLHSHAGYYIGRMHWSPDYGGFVEPGSRESDYFASKAEAEVALKGSFEPRECVENEAMYARGVPRPAARGNHG